MPQLVEAPFRPASVAAMRGYIPAAIYARLAAGQTDWLGELRKVSVVFANLPGFNKATPVELRDRISEIGWECSIGIATARIFCGAYGNDDRREYTMIGAD